MVIYLKFPIMSNKLDGLWSAFYSTAMYCNIEDCLTGQDHFNVGSRSITAVSCFFSPRRKIISYNTVCGRTVCWFLWPHHRKQYVLLLFLRKENHSKFGLMLKKWSFVKLVSFFFLFPAFNKLVSVNCQDFNLQLVDTAGQVSCSSGTTSETRTELLVDKCLLNWMYSFL